MQAINQGDLELSSRYFPAAGNHARNEEPRVGDRNVFYKAKDDLGTVQSECDSTACEEGGTYESYGR